ncbi:hypothetical protein MHTCC0001_23510 [Flavobacteriaceae bacterium MHTCC 0001]
MKYFILFFLSSICSHGQIDDKKQLIDCSDLNETIIDDDLFDKLSGGKLIFRGDPRKIYQITLNNGEFYYASKPLMKRIKRSIKLNNCENVGIKKLKNIDNSHIKIIRH